MSACDLRPPEQQLITASARSSALEAKNDFSCRSIHKTEKCIHSTAEVLRYGTTNPEAIHRMESLSRRRFIGELTTIGAGALLAGTASATQRGPARGGKINIHHHLTAPAYVKVLTENKVRDFPTSRSPKASKIWTRRKSQPRSPRS